MLLTLLHAMAGLEPIDGGEVTVDGTLVNVNYDDVADQLQLLLDLVGDVDLALAQMPGDR